jgi:HEAT repeat protein/energy-coupling factor transporter ATP-binding protein EcfA2
MSLGMHLTLGWCNIAMKRIACLPPVGSASNSQHTVQLCWLVFATPANLEERVMEDAERAYRDWVTQEYGTLNFAGFGSAAPSLVQIRLDQIFVRLRLTTKRGDEGSPQESGQLISLAEALGKPLLVVGEPGAGKSTLLRWLAVTFAQRRQRDPDRLGQAADDDLLPILIDLGRLPDDYLIDQRNKTIHWQTLLPKQVLQQERFQNTPPELLQKALKDGRCLLLFDGLDEIANRQARARLADSLARLPSLYPGNRIVVGSRPAGLTSESKGALYTFLCCQIQRFTSKELQRFFQFCYTLDPTLPLDIQQREADALYESIKAAPQTLNLARTPLLATLLWLTWLKEGTLPERRVDLYERCCQVLVEEWEWGHDVAYREGYSALSVEQHLRLLSYIAFAIHRQEQRTSISQEELRRLVLEALQKEGSNTAEIPAIRFLETLALRSSLLQFQGDGQYGFPHLTIQEYLAARHIAAQPDPEPINLVMEHLHDAWWEEVHLLTVGRLGSGPQGAVRTAALLGVILHYYRPPSRLLRLPLHPRRIDLGRWLPQAQLARRLAWLLRREEIFALWGAAECTPDGLPPTLLEDLTTRAVDLTRAMLAHPAQRPLLVDWIRAPGRQLPSKASKAREKALESALTDPDQDVRHTAAWIRRRLSSEQQAAGSQWQLGGSIGWIDFFDSLTASQPDRDEDEQPIASSRASHIRRRTQAGSSQDISISALLDSLHNPDQDVRAAAAQTLGKLGSDKETVIPALFNTLHDTNRNVRLGAAQSLVRLGTSGEDVISILLDALHDPDQDVRLGAARSLGELGSGKETVIPALIDALRNDPFVLVRETAVHSLGQLGRDEETVILTLSKALRDLDQSTRVAAAFWLSASKISNPKQLRSVLVALNRYLHDLDADYRNRLWDLDGNEREVALEAIKQLVEGRALPAFQWKPVYSSLERTRRRKLLGTLATAVLGLLALVLGFAWLSGVPPFNSVFAGLASAIGLIAGLAGLAGVTLRDLVTRWSHKNQKGS